MEKINESLGELKLAFDKPNTAPCVAADITAFEMLQSRNGYKQSEQSLAALKAFADGYGVGLFGSVGTGKTYFFSTLPKTPAFNSCGYCAKVIERRWMSPIELAGETLATVMREVRATLSQELVLDDLGAEPTLSDYGSRMEVMPLIIDARIRASARTFFTTNLTASELQAKYGVRTVDRLCQLCKCFTFKGESARNPIPNALAVKGMRQARDFRAKTRLESL